VRLHDITTGLSPLCQGLAIARRVQAGGGGRGSFTEGKLRKLHVAHGRVRDAADGRAGERTRPPNRCNGNLSNKSTPGMGGKPPAHILDPSSDAIPERKQVLEKSGVGLVLATESCTEVLLKIKNKFASLWGGKVANPALIRLAWHPGN